MKDLPMDVLRAFVTIVDRGGFTAAAEALNVTQPTISLQLKKLEKLVGCPVLERGYRKQRLTSEGTALLDYAKRILMLNDEAISYLVKPDIRGRLKIGIPHEFTMSILPGLVGSFSQVHPNIVIEIECELSKTLLSNPLDYDLVIALNDISQTSEGIHLRNEPLAWVGSLDYRLEEKKPVDVVAAPAPCIYRSHLQSALRHCSAGWNLRLTSTSYDAVCAAVRSGLGMTVLAHSVIPDGLREFSEKDGLQKLADVELRLHHNRSTASPAVNRFVEFTESRFVNQS